MTPIRRIQPATDHLSAGTVDSRAGFFVPSGGSSAGRHFSHLLPRVVHRVNPTAGSVLRTVHAGDVGHRGCERADVKKRRHHSGVSAVGSFVSSTSKPFFRRVPRGWGF